VKNRPEGFIQATSFIHPNLRDVVLAGVVARAVVAKSPKGEPSRDIESLWGRNSAFEPREAESFENKYPVWGIFFCAKVF